MKACWEYHDIGFTFVMPYIVIHANATTDMKAIRPVRIPTIDVSFPFFPLKNRYINACAESLNKLLHGLSKRAVQATIMDNTITNISISNILTVDHWTETSDAVVEEI